MCVQRFGSVELWLFQGTFCLVVWVCTRIVAQSIILLILSATDIPGGDIRQSESVYTVWRYLAMSKCYRTDSTHRHGTCVCNPQWCCTAVLGSLLLLCGYFVLSYCSSHGNVGHVFCIVRMYDIIVSVTSSDMVTYKEAHTPSEHVMQMPALVSALMNIYCGRGSRLVYIPCRPCECPKCRFFLIQGGLLPQQHRCQFFISFARMGGAVSSVVGVYSMLLL